MTSSVPDFVVATVVGVTACSIFSGGNFVISLITVPMFINSNPAPKDSPRRTADTLHLARQWQDLYDVGSKVGPVLSITSLSGFIYASRQLPAGATVQRQLLLAAAALSVAIVPYTFTAMLRTNNELHRRAKLVTTQDEVKVGGKATIAESTSTIDLLRSWTKLNLGRVALNLAAVGCAMMALSL